ncbi:hypothetical protein LTR36_002019 [Oleoguttula mirabilis]|uniref:Fe2OG dioxygenase domain-containing protein n=1 Tax=Oleoguttula mirabilis TaxID=1507867 RepID=A0AAV9JM16_9PEZI|nr:hypothetical protein LTR36_002019 [Oleoguttula mirabilis]
MKPEAVSNAVSQDGLEIPLIDFSAFMSGDETTKRTTAQSIVHGFQRAGFIYLKNHGIPKADVANTFAESAKFFRRPSSQKEAMGWTTPEANRGYSQPGREKTTDLKDAADIEAKRAEEGADLKESFEIGREGEPNHPNHWPDRFDDNGADFKKQMLHFHDTCKQLHMQVMRAMAVGLGIDESWFDSFCDGGDNTLRLLHYPEVQSTAFKKNKNTVRAGAHTDYGSITLLFQDMAGGLQVLSPNGNFIDATPIADTIVVNAADLLARWSNDTIKSTKHRVVEPPIKADVHPARYSIAYFCNPNFDRFIDAILGTYDELKGDKKYEGINSGDYLAQRLAATY